MTTGPDRHSLRLWLDLQLDTLIFTLAAAATQAGLDDGEATGTAATDGGRLPLHEWLSEDLDCAITLATGPTCGTDDLPGSLAGGAGRPADRVRLDLAARYRTLVDLIDLAGADGADEHLLAVRRRYAERLDVLEPL